MGRLEEAREIVERLRAFTTGVLESFSYVRNSGHRELLLSGLRLAMGRRHEPDPPSRRDPCR